MGTTDSQNVSAEAGNIDTTENGSGVGDRNLVRCAEDLMYAARRMRNKYGRGKNDALLDWTEWTDVDDAANAIEEILSANDQEQQPEPQD